MTSSKLGRGWRRGKLEGEVAARDTPWVQPGGLHPSEDNLFAAARAFNSMGMENVIRRHLPSMPDVAAKETFRRDIHAPS